MIFLLSVIPLIGTDCEFFSAIVILPAGPHETWGLDCISTSSGGILCPLMHLSMSFSYMPLGTGGLVVVPARRSDALTLLAAGKVLPN